MMDSRELRKIISDKVCPLHGRFETQAATLEHMAKEHTVIEREERGPVVIERVIQPPYPRERSPRISSRVLYKGQEIDEAGWHAEWFVRGVEWAVANL